MRLCRAASEECRISRELGRNSSRRVYAVAIGDGNVGQGGARTRPGVCAVA